MKRGLVAMGGIFVAWTAIAQARFPEDVTRFTERRDACDHFRGEGAYDAERRRFLEQKTRELCVGSDKQLAALMKKYAGNGAVVKKLSEYEAEIEGAPQK